MFRKIVVLCVSVLFIFTCSFTALAQDFDPQKSGSVSVTLNELHDKQYVVGAELSIYYVATVHLNENGKLSYAYTDEFEKIGIDLSDPSLPEKLDAFVSENDIYSFKITTDERGTATCNNLELGLYFIKQTGVVDGFAPCTSFMVTLPGVNEGDYLYEVNASPKTEVVRLTSITIKKEWNTDASSKAADSVTVQLLKNENVVKTAILNSQNNWQVTYDDMPESDAYSIKEIDVPKGFTATYKQNGYVFTVINSSTLIQTGQLIWPIPVLLVVGMVLIAIGIILLKKKRKTNA